MTQKISNTDLIDPIDLIDQDRFAKIPKEDLEISDLLKKSNEGIPVIIHIILNRQLGLVPKRLLTHEVLSQLSPTLESGYLLAADSWEFHEIPPHLITKEILCETSCYGGHELHTVWGMLVKNKAMNPLLPHLATLINELDGSNKTPFLHLCTITGQLHKIPKSLLTVNTVFRTTTEGNQNLLHLAAFSGELNEIPKEFLTEYAVSLPTHYGETPIQIAAENDNLHQIPTEFLTDKYLKASKSVTHLSPLQLAAHFCAFKNFPKHLITESNLLDKGPHNSNSPLFILCANYCPTDPNKMKKAGKALDNILKLLPLKPLVKLKEDLKNAGHLEPITLINRAILKQKLKEQLKKENQLEI